MRTLLIDDKRDIDATRVCRTYYDGLAALKHEGPWDILYLDHDLGEKDGRDGTGIMNWLEANPQYMPKQIKVVSSNPVGAARMELIIKKIIEGKL
jgi:hypothetical protein